MDGVRRSPTAQRNQSNKIEHTAQATTPEPRNINYEPSKIELRNRVRVSKNTKFNIKFNIKTNQKSNTHTNELKQRGKAEETIDQQIDESRQSYISVIYWNVRGLGSLYTTLDLDTVDNFENCVMLFVSETWSANAIKKPPAFLSHMSCISRPACREKDIGRHSGGLALFYDPIIVKEVNTLEINEIWISISCRIFSEEYIVIGVYVRDSNFTTRINMLEDHLAELTNRSDHLPIIVGGDFNARIGLRNQVDEEYVDGSSLSAKRESVDYQLVSRNGEATLEAMESRGYIVVNGKSLSDSRGGYTFLGASGASTIDLVWVNLNAAKIVKDLQILNIGFSDHLPVKLTLWALRDGEETLEIQNVTQKEIYKWDPVKRTEFTEKMARTPCGLSREVDVNTLASSLCSAVKRTAVKLDMVKVAKSWRKGTCKSKPWFDENCRLVRRKLNRGYRSAYKSTNSNGRDLVIKTREEYLALIKSKKKRYVSNLQRELVEATDMKSFWRVMNKYSFRQTRKCQISAESWHNFYAKILPKAEERVDEFVDCRHPQLDAEITLTELEKAIRQTKGNKSPGPDGITANFYKSMSPNWKFHLVRLLNKVLETGVVPEEWCKAEVIMLYKKGDVLDHLNYRGIALANTIAKIFTTIIASRLSDCCDISNILPEAQAGFRRNRSCEDNIFTLHTKITQMLCKPKGKMYAVFVDFRRAFDSVVHRVLWQKLYKAGVSSQLIRVLQDLYTKASMRVKLNNNSVTDYLDITEGVMQGDPLSPLLFIMLLFDIDLFFMDNGHREINERMKLLLFADDLVILAKNIFDLQDKLNTLAKFCEENCLTVNVNKTKIMLFRKAGRPPKQKAVKYLEETIEVVKTFTFLGVTFSASGLFTKACTSSITKARLAVSTVWTRMLASKMTSWSQRIILFNAIVSATLLYCAGIWGLGHVHELDKVKRGFIKGLLDIPRCTPGYMIRLETGTRTLEGFIVRRALVYLRKILSMPDHRFPSKSLRILQQLDVTPSNITKRNWWSLLKEVILRAGFGHILDLASVAVVDTAITEIIINQEKLMYIDDCRRAKESSYSPIFKELKNLDVQECEKYIKKSYPLGYIRLLAQARLAGREIVEFKIGRIKYSIETSKVCELCNLKQNETLKHFLCDCPLLTNIRSAFIPNLGLQEILNVSEFTDVKKVCFYIINSLKLRAFALSE